ncbi:MAG: sulfatase-like hydrolase/transferase, partial [Reichenbachiella sp.]
MTKRVAELPYSKIAKITCLALVFMSWILPGFGQSQPNIILFYVDDLGWSDLGYMGSEFYESPIIDSLAGESMVFTSAYANAANCAPSRASMLSGLYTPRHGVY